MVVYADRSPARGVDGGVGSGIAPNRLGERGWLAGTLGRLVARRGESAQRDAGHRLSTGKAGMKRRSWRA